MSARFVIVPEWQASASSRAMRLIDGAEAIRGDLPSDATRQVEVPMEAGESLESGVDRLSTILLVRDALADALAGDGDPTIILGGDAGIELAAVSHATTASGNVALVWLSARPALATPGTTSTGAFESMVLATILGDGTPRLTPELARRPGAAVLAGLRTVEDAEAAEIASRGIPTVDVPDLAEPAKLVSAIEDTGMSSVYLHVSLDVLDPAEFAGLDDPQPFGVTVPALCDALRAVRSRFPLAGAGVTGFAPSSPDAAADDLGAILRIVSALTSPVPGRASRA